MKVKCRGYEGYLVDLEAMECFIRGVTGDCYKLGGYNIEIRINPSTKVCLDEVKDKEIEVIHED